MQPLRLNIESATVRNKAYRKVLYTTPNMQLVLMSLAPKAIIPIETHPRLTQFVRVEAGRGVAVIRGRRYRLSDGVAVIIPPGARHEIRNTSGKDHLKLYTLYSPPEHPRGKLETQQIFH